MLILPVIMCDDPAETRSGGKYVRRCNHHRQMHQAPLPMPTTCPNNPSFLRSPPPPSFSDLSPLFLLLPEEDLPVLERRTSCSCSTAGSPTGVPTCRCLSAFASWCQDFSAYLKGGVGGGSYQRHKGAGGRICQRRCIICTLLLTLWF